MDAKEIRNLYVEAYEYELQYKDTLNARLNLPVTGLIVLVGAVAYLLNNISKLTTHWVAITFYVLLALLVLSIGFALYFLIRIIFGPKYGYISQLSEIDRYIRQIEQYNEEADEEPIALSEELDDLLKQQYCKCTSRNQQNNDCKSGYLARCLYAMIVATVILVVSGVPYYGMKLGTTDDVQKIEVTNLTELMSMAKKEKPQGSSGDEKPSTSESKPTKPERPQTQLRKETDVKPRADRVTEKKG